MNEHEKKIQESSKAAKSHGGANEVSDRNKVFRENVFVVPNKFDHTPDTLQPLDHYLLDRQVGQLIRIMHEYKGDWINWAKEHPGLAAPFFSGPFSKTAESAFGYGGGVEDGSR
jgi:hypothetical protein